MHIPISSSPRGAFAVLTLTAASLQAAGTIIPLPAVVVTGHHSDQPLLVSADPRAPAQPIPAQDGAEILRNIPGFSVIRKGGIDGDPVLRGMAGSRLGVLLDGDVVLGGCGNRMDPPTAYVHPAAFDRVTVLKGPETVLHGPGYSAGVVRFERDPRKLSAPQLAILGSATLGSFGRNDQALRLLAGTPAGYIETNATRAASDEYRTGSGEKVHSAYERWNVHAAIGLTPADQTLLEVSAAIGDGEAAYADRAMDGVKFARENLAFRMHRQFASGAVRRLEGRVYYNYVDHVMDNFTLRTFQPAGGMSQPAVSNPDRRTHGGRMQVTAAVANRATVDLGVDLQANRHRIRSTTDQRSRPFGGLPRLVDARFRQGGMFGEVTMPFGTMWRALAGGRVDDWEAQDRRATVGSGMSGGSSNPTAGARRHQTLEAGFVRFERERDGNTIFLGLGHSARFPDYWEMFSKESTASVSAFSIRPEHTNQVDGGVIVRRGSFTGSVSLFANRVDDYILIQSGVRKGMRTVTVARNVDASSLGGEVTTSAQLTAKWKADASITYVRAENRSDNLPLAQQPPLEGRFALAYTNASWSVGALTRMAAAQHRVAVGHGNIAGQDIAATGGFAVLSLNGAWRFHRRTRVAAGIDNVLDRAYAEHISRSGISIPGYAQTARVMEPGRTFWMKVDLAY